MELVLVVSFPDQPDREGFTVVADPRDQLVWERAKKGRSLGDLLTLQVRIEDLYSLAHIAAKRTKKYLDDLAVFEVEAAVVMGRRDDSDEDPSPEGPSADESSS
ncbi:MAG: hypothetical protein HOQ21_09800 [Dermatophilaceae bacterium]|nr:hypothetical protein [Dermatophilaceae bacterium]